MAFWEQPIGGCLSHSGARGYCRWSTGAPAFRRTWWVRERREGGEGEGEKQRKRRSRDARRDEREETKQQKRETGGQKDKKTESVLQSLRGKGCVICLFMGLCMSKRFLCTRADEGFGYPLHWELGLLSSTGQSFLVWFCFRIRWSYSSSRVALWGRQWR